MSIRKTDVIVVIPAFNEGTRISTVILELTDAGYDVVCIDDGSSDDTYDQILATPAAALRHCVNLGQGAALATGFKYAEGTDHSYVVTFDADGQHEVKDIETALDALVESDVDVVLGSRFLGVNESMPFGRKLMLRLATIFTRLTTELEVTDTHNGFRVLKSTALPYFRLKQNRMAHASEIHEIIKRESLSFVERPNTIRYTKETLAKGQRLTGAFSILSDLALGRMYK